ncbi:hypothetical protein CJ030_MR1G019290 [Morella rubra]|uniref:Uncharacterized protein n=1 Tax=Morella rubra TaxID=262757 RepID=A0A6A1WNU3_9ROSI|nr:hypothetical protein CJ030_MR1G019290 [Morella rubra]
MLATSSPLPKPLPSSERRVQWTPETNGEDLIPSALVDRAPTDGTHLGAKVAHRHGSTSTVGDSGTSAIKHSSKIEGGVGRGGGYRGNGGNGNNGDSTSSPDAHGSGTALIPVYAAGGANNRHPKHHRGSGNCNRNSIRLSTLVAAILAPFIPHLYY